MKSMKKVLASLLALAMVVTAVPVTNTSAATGVSLNKTAPSVYASRSKNIKVTAGSAWKSVKIKKVSVDVTSGEGTVLKAAKVANKKVKITGYSAGTATVTVKVTGKKNGVSKTKTLKATVTVKPVEINAVSEEATMTVGDTLSESDLFTKKPANKQLKYVSSDETVATVDSDGTVTAVGAGTATITASSVYAEESASVDVTVTAAELVLTDVKQASTTTLTATFSGDASSVETGDITVTENATSANVSVKSVAVNDDTSEVTITTYNTLANSTVYDVTYGDVTISVTTTDGTVDSITVTPTEIVCATETDIYAYFWDADGVELGSVTYGTTSFDSKVLDFTIDEGDGYTTSTGLYLASEGDTAVVNVTLHSGEYDSDGNETGNITSGDVTITATAAATISSWSVLYSKTLYTSYSAASETKVAAGDDAYAYILKTLTDSSTDYSIADYTFESSDDDVMTVGVYDEENGILDITANSAGTANIIVKDSDGNTVKTFSLTVYAARKATTLSLSDTSVTLSTATQDNEAVETATITPVVYDQYGDSYATSDSDTFTVANAASSTSATAATTMGAIIQTSNLKDGGNGTSDTISGSAFVVDVSGVEDSITSGSSLTYKVSVTYGSLSKTLTIVAKRPSAESKYVLELSDSSVDAVITSSLTTHSAITATVYTCDSNGVKINVTTAAALAVTKGSSDIDEDAIGTDPTVSTSSAAGLGASTLTFHVNNVTSGTAIDTGTYKITATVLADDSVTESEVKLSKTLKVTNSQPTATYTLNSVSGDSTNLNDYITITYDGTTYDDAIVYYSTSSSDGLDAASVEAPSTGKVYVKNVTVMIELVEGLVYVNQDITIGKTITIN